LIADDRARARARLQLVAGEVAHAQPAHLALGAQLQQLVEHVVGAYRRIGPVDLHQIDDVDAQAAQAVLAAAAYGRRAHVVVDGVRGLVLVDHGETVGAGGAVPDEATLRRDQDLVAAAADGLADQLFAAPHAVDRGGVDHGDAGVDAGLDRG